MCNNPYYTLTFGCWTHFMLQKPHHRPITDQTTYTNRRVVDSLIFALISASSSWAASAGCIAAFVSRERTSFRNLCCN